MLSLYGLVAICIGSILGALGRYGLAVALNAFMPYVPVGTLVANLVAAYIVGLAIAYFAAMPELDPAWRLFVITGLAGGLSTFSTFSAELLSLLQGGRLGWAAAMVAAHVGGSLVMTAIGMASLPLFRSA